MSDHESSEREVSPPRIKTLQELLDARDATPPPPLPEHLKSVVLNPGPAPWVRERYRLLLRPRDPSEYIPVLSRRQRARKEAEEEKAREAAEEVKSQKAAEEEEVADRTAEQEVAANQADDGGEVEMQDAPPADIEEEQQELMGQIVLASKTGSGHGTSQAGSAESGEVNTVMVIVPSKRRRGAERDAESSSDGEQKQEQEQRAKVRIGMEQDMDLDVPDESEEFVALTSFGRREIKGLEWTRWKEVEMLLERGKSLNAVWYYCKLRGKPAEMGEAVQQNVLKARQVGIRLIKEYNDKQKAPKRTKTVP